MPRYNYIFTSTHPAMRSLLRNVTSGLQHRLHRTPHSRRLQRLHSAFANGHVQISVIAHEFYKREHFGLIMVYRFTTTFRRRTVTTEAFFKIKFRTKRGWVDRIRDDVGEVERGSEVVEGGVGETAAPLG